jgi:hypothetical protein
VQLEQEGNHGDEGCDGEDGDGSGGFFADVDLALGEVVADC